MKRKRQANRVSTGCLVDGGAIWAARDARGLSRETTCDELEALGVELSEQGLMLLEQGQVADTRGSVLCGLALVLAVDVWALVRLPRGVRVPRGGA